MSKWNEKLIMKFLKVYKLYPCLWNPYDKRYYNCKEKNEALQRIIDDLCIPSFTITDYLQQIKLIREKYKKEQLRTIKELQLHKQYKSPVPWYNIVANMLMKVISDEEKMNSVVAAKTVPPDTSVFKSLSSDNIHYTDKKEDKTRIQPCTNTTCDIVARRSRSARSSIKYTPSKTTAIRSSTRTKYVLCPQARITSKTRNGDGLSNRKPKRAFNLKPSDFPRTPSNSVNSIATNSTKASTTKYEPPFLKCPACGWERMQEQRTIIPCVNYSTESTGLKHAPCNGCNKDATHHFIHPETYTDDSGDFVRNLYKSAPAKVSTLDTATQTTESPQTQVMQLDPTVKTAFAGGAIEACTRFKIILPDSKKNLEMHTVGTQSVCQCTQGVQCLQPQLYTKGTQLSRELKKNAHTSTVTYKERGTQCTVCVPEERRCSASIQTITQSSVHTMTRFSSLERMKDVGTASSVHRIHSSDSVTLISYKSVGTGGECVLPSRAKSHGSLKRCIQQKDYKEVAIGESELKILQPQQILKYLPSLTAELYIKSCNADTCPRNMSELMKDPGVSIALQQFLCKMLSSKTNRVSRCIKSQTDFEQRSIGCATDATEMVKRIKEYAITALGVRLPKDECVQTSTDTETPSVCVNKLTMTKAGPYKPINRSTGVQEDGSNRLSTFKETKKPVVDKEVCTCCEYKDIGTNGSLLRTCDMGVQNDVDNSVCSNRIETDKHLRSTVGTQKRDPILVRVIKCTDAQTIKKSDKETLTDKRTESCGRSTCTPRTVCTTSYKEEPKHQVNRDYHERSFMYRCDDTCKGKPFSNKDWTDVTNVDAFNCIHNSKIPLCTYPARKCTFTRSN